MPVELYHLIAFLISVTVVLWTIPDVKTVALRFGIVDKPNARKIHKAPVARVGGVSIFTGTIIALLIVWRLGGFTAIPLEQQTELWGLIIGSVLFFCIGFADDLLNLSASSRLFMQIVVATLSWLMGVRIDFLSVPFSNLIQTDFLSLPITVIWLVGMANAINWIDGVDGLAAGVSGIAAVVMLIVTLFMDQPAAAVVAAALAGSALGFLRYNFNPAQIFMGDTGSLTIGGLIAVLAVMIRKELLIPLLCGIFFHGILVWFGFHLFHCLRRIFGGSCLFLCLLTFCN